jgi:hypothetical protein
MTAFVNSDINLITYWNKDEKLIASITIDVDNKKLIPFPKGLTKYLQPNSLLIKRIDSEKDIRGYLLLDDGIMMVAVCACNRWR